MSSIRFLDLPVEILNQVASLLDASDLLTLRRVNKELAAKTEFRMLIKCFADSKCMLALPWSIVKATADLQLEKRERLQRKYNDMTYYRNHWHSMYTDAMTNFNTTKMKLKLLRLNNRLGYTNGPEPSDARDAILAMRRMKPMPAEVRKRPSILEERSSETYERFTANPNGELAIIVMARMSSARLELAGTYAAMRTGNIAVGGRAIQYYAPFMSICGLYTVERIRRSRDDLRLNPNSRHGYVPDLRLAMTLEHLRQLGKRVLIIERGYDGITNPRSLRRWMRYWFNRGLKLDLQIYQKMASPAIARHPFVVLHTRYCHQIWHGHITPVFPSTAFITPTQPIALYNNLLQNICDSKQQGMAIWYNSNRNSY